MSVASRVLSRTVFRAAICIASLFAVLAGAGQIGAKEWARKMFETTNHDFGTVARGAKAEYEFVLENIYEEDVHIASVRSSCGCTTPSIVKETLKTWEKGAIRAIFNTRSFSGQKNATITVVIDQPFPAEVQLTVGGFIRTDVVVQPGSVEFGDVDAGQRVSEKVQIKYAGRSNWRIDKIQKPAFVDLEVEPPRLVQGAVTYDMLLTLRDDAPVGYLTDQIILETNDASLSRIPFTLSGRVRPSLTVSPASITMGVLRPGEKSTKQIVVRANEPFRIQKIECDSDCFSFRTNESPKKLHLIPVTFTASEDTGEMQCQIRIDTDLKDGTSAGCLATVIVKPPDPVDFDEAGVSVGDVSTDVPESE